MNTRQKILIRFPAAIVTVALMVLAAELFDEPEIIFPEIAALTVGAFLSDHMPWKVTSIRMLLLMSVSALMGYGLSAFVPLPMFLKVMIAFIVCIFALGAAKSTMLPMLSAGILPILTNVQSIIYPLSVLTLTAAVIGIRLLLEEYGVVDVNQYDYEDPEPKMEWVRRLWLILGFGIMAAVAIGSGMICLIAPPLAVIFAEAAEIESPVHKAPLRFFLCTVLCTFFGTSCRLVCVDLFRLPLTVGATAAAAGAIGLLMIFRKPFPPAAALAVLPFILSEEMVMVYPFQVTAGCGVFIGLDVLYRTAMEKGLWQRAADSVIDFVLSLQIIQPEKLPAEHPGEPAAAGESVEEVKQQNVRSRI